MDTNNEPPSSTAPTQKHIIYPYVSKDAINWFIKQAKSPSVKTQLKEILYPIFEVLFQDLYPYAYIIIFLCIVILCTLGLNLAVLIIIVIQNWKSNIVQLQFPKHIPFFQSAKSSTKE